LVMASLEPPTAAEMAPAMSAEPFQPESAPSEAAQSGSSQSMTPDNSEATSSEQSAKRSTEPFPQPSVSTTPHAPMEASHEASAPVAAEPPKPKVVEKPAPPKPYALLSDAQIASIKERLKLSPDQEYYWPSVENALHAIAHRIQANRRADPHATGVPIDPDSPEVQELKSAAMPLLWGLREDQKREVRSLARLIGLEKVAAMI
jgi:hypothetical protein